MDFEPANRQLEEPSRYVVRQERIKKREAMAFKKCLLYTDIIHACYFEGQDSLYQQSYLWIRVSVTR